MGDDGTMTKGTRYTPEFKASAPNRLHVADITYVRMAGPTGSRTIPIKPGLLLSRGTVRGLGGWPCPMWFPGLTFRVMFVLSHLIRTKEFAMGETTVGHVAGEVVRALYGAGYMESTIGQYRNVFSQVGVSCFVTNFFRFSA